MTFDTSTIEQTVMIPASPDEVYEGFVDPDIHTLMTGGEAKGGQQVGDSFTAWGGYIEGKYLELVPGKKIVAEWSTGEWPDGAAPSRLELNFSEKDRGTEVHMIHSNIPPHEADYERGWHQNYWEPMGEYFSHKA